MKKEKKTPKTLKHAPGNKGRRGGAQPGAGRKKGIVSAAKLDLKEKAQEYGERALQVLIEVAESGDTSSARVSAANALLDRGYGRPLQEMKHNGDSIMPLSLNIVAVAPVAARSIEEKKDDVFAISGIRAPAQ